MPYGGVMLALSSPMVLDHNCWKVREAEGGPANFFPCQQDF